MSLTREFVGRKGKKESLAFKNTQKRLGKLAQLVKALAAKPDVLSSSSMIDLME